MNSAGRFRGQREAALLRRLRPVPHRKRRLLQRTSPHRRERRRDRREVSRCVCVPEELGLLPTEGGQCDRSKPRLDRKAMGSVGARRASEPGQRIEGIACSPACTSTRTSSARDRGQEAGAENAQEINARKRSMWWPQREPPAVDRHFLPSQGYCPRSGMSAPPVRLLTAHSIGVIYCLWNGRSSTPTSSGSGGTP